MSGLLEEREELSPLCVEEQQDKQSWIEVEGDGLGNKHDSPMRCHFSGDRLLAGEVCSVCGTNYVGLC